MAELHVPDVNGKSTTSEPVPGGDAGVQPSEPSSSGTDSGAAAKPKAREIADYAKRRHNLDDRARRLREREQQVNETLAQYERRLADADNDRKELRAKLEAWERGNPLAVAQAAGRDIDGAIREFVSGDTPEAKIAKLEAKLRERDERDAAREKANEKAEQDKQTRTQQEFIQARRVNFVKHLTADTKKFHYLNHEYDEAQLYEIASRFEDWCVSERKQYTWEQAASELERLAKQRYDVLEPKRALLRGAESPSAAPPVSGASGNGRPARGPDAARRSAPEPAPKPRPKSRAMTRDEETEHDLALLRAAREKDRLARLPSNGKAS